MARWHSVHGDKDSPIKMIKNSVDERPNPFAVNENIFLNKNSNVLASYRDDVFHHFPGIFCLSIGCNRYNPMA